MITKDATLLEGAIGFQVVGSKYKEVTSGDKEIYWPSKKAKEKYCKSNAVKIKSVNLCERYVCTRQDYLVYYLR